MPQSPREFTELQQKRQQEREDSLSRCSRGFAIFQAIYESGKKCKHTLCKKAGGNVNKHSKLLQDEKRQMWWKVEMQWLKPTVMEFWKKKSLFFCRISIAPEISIFHSSSIKFLIWRYVRWQVYIGILFFKQLYIHSLWYPRNTRESYFIKMDQNLTELLEHSVLCLSPCLYLDIVHIFGMTIPQLSMTRNTIMSLIHYSFLLQIF